MRNLRLGDEAQICASRHCCSACAYAVLEAAHVRGCHGCDAAVGLVVFGLADGDPFCGFGDAVDDEFGEAIWREGQYWWVM